jgi:hypothetical protein
MHFMSDSNSPNTPNQTPNPGTVGVMPTAEALAAAAAAMGTDTQAQQASVPQDPLADAQAELANVKAQNATLADQYLRWKVLPTVCCPCWTVWKPVWPFKTSRQSKFAKALKPRFAN